MENASKALLMAGGVLISLLVIGALILMFSNLTNYQGTETQGTREAQIQKFNEEYETYNRNDVRGNDIYSLISKVVNYNKRKSSVATGNEEGQDLQYEPMSLTIEIGDTDTIKEYFTIDNTIRFLTSSVVNGSGNIEVNQARTNNLETHVINNIKSLETEFGGSSSLVNLTTGIGKLFPGGSPNDKTKQTAVDLWNNNVPATKRLSSPDLDTNYDNLQSSDNIKNDVSLYYEYVHFKRAHFDCKNATYNNQTGRIVSMTFKFNKKIN